MRGSFQERGINPCSEIDLVCRASRVQFFLKTYVTGVVTSDFRNFRIGIGHQMPIHDLPHIRAARAILISIVIRTSPNDPIE